MIHCFFIILDMYIPTLQLAILQMGYRDKSKQRSRQKKQNRRQSPYKQQQKSRYRHNTKGRNEDRNKNHSNDHKKQQSHQQTNRNRHQERQYYRSTKQNQIVLNNQRINEIEQKRRQICPFLVHTYYSVNNPNLFKKEDDLPKDRHLLLYLWMGTSLTEIAELLRAHVPALRSKQKYVISRVYDQNGRLAKQQIGTVMVNKKNMPIAIERDCKLSESSFNIGDYIDVCVTFN